MKAARIDKAVDKSPPFIVELVGPAGAGKSTLAQALSQSSSSVLMCHPPYYRRIDQFPFFAKNVFLFLPTAVSLHNGNHGRRLTRREIAAMVILQGWHHRLAQKPANQGKVVVLDQGPVYMLAGLHGFGPRSLQSQSAKPWWNRTYERWAATLDMIIWLDTSDATLLERIRARDSWHIVKGKSTPDALEFLTRCRRAYEQVLSTLTTGPTGPKVLHFDTALESVDEIVKQVLSAWRLKDSQGQAMCRCGDRPG